MNPGVTLSFIRGPVNLGGGHPFKSSSLKPGAGGLSKIGSAAVGEARFSTGSTHWRDPTCLRSVPNQRWCVDGPAFGFASRRTASLPRQLSAFLVVSQSAPNSGRSYGLDFRLLACVLGQQFVPFFRFSKPECVVLIFKCHALAAEGSHCTTMCKYVHAKLPHD
jgi:hypothetical protein